MAKRFSCHKISEGKATADAIISKDRIMFYQVRPEDGMKVIAHGRVSVFPGAGQHQLYIDALQPDGVGALYMAYEQLKERLGKEGLFDPAHKKPLPQFPEKIAIITSSAGNAEAIPSFPFYDWHISPMCRPQKFSF